MKNSILILFLTVTAIYAFQANTIQDLVCETWRGWGENWVDLNCSLSLNASCVAAFDIVPRFFTFITTFDFSHLGIFFTDIWTVLIESIKQPWICNFGTSTIGRISLLVWPYAGYLVFNIFRRWATIEMSLSCTIMFAASGEYYKAGDCFSDLCNDLFYL